MSNDFGANGFGTNVKWLWYQLVLMSMPLIPMSTDFCIQWLWYQCQMTLVIVSTDIDTQWLWYHSQLILVPNDFGTNIIN